ncbi:MAD2L1-binding protein isoform X2 [Protopterus annectens]|uniref:MAD2L1-binding protein isoform X2 n=1 Tax=Protopterus annectens TaxID=7888 RepID=UPI001CFA9E9A|nr:MAD2L1-binding protein isoform X2 [Protopterus annectens]
MADDSNSLLDECFLLPDGTIPVKGSVPEGDTVVDAHKISPGRDGKYLCYGADKSSNESRAWRNFHLGAKKNEETVFPLDSSLCRSGSKNNTRSSREEVCQIESQETRRQTVLASETSIDLGVQDANEFHGEISRILPDGSCLVPVVFPGCIAQESCCKFVCEIFKHVLYQRAQLPLPYDQLVFFHKKQETNQTREATTQKSSWNLDRDSKKQQKVLSELEEVLSNIETLFTLTFVPRVLILLGGSVVCPKEMYEIVLEGVSLGNGEESLKTSSCGHRDCGTQWFRPKLDYKVPARGKRLTISLSSSGTDFGLSLKQATPDSDNYIWFQAPVTIKGFRM